MRTPIRFLIFITTLIGTACGPAAHTQNPPPTYDVHFGSTHFKAALIPPGGLSRESALALGRAFISGANLGTISELILADDAAQLKAITTGTIPAAESEESFDRTRQQLQAAFPGGWPSRQVARVIAFHGAALFSFRESGRGEKGRPGVFESVVAGPSDPTRIELPEGDFRLLHLGVTGRKESSYINLKVFLKASGEAPCHAVQELSEYFQELAGAHTVEVEVREDTWFASISFPLFFAFEPDTAPGTHIDMGQRVYAPTVATFYRMPRTHGYWNAGGFSCERYGTLEHMP